MEKLQHLLSEDLFNVNAQQVFDAKTGQHIGYIKDGVQILFSQKEEKKKDEDKGKNQLSLF